MICYATEDRPMPPEDAAPKRIILVIDDEPNIRKLVSGVLAKTPESQVETAVDGQDAVEWLERAGWRVQETVQQLIEFARPASNTVEQISVNQTIQSALGLVGEHIQSSGVSLSIQLEASLPPVQGNARRLTELWVSLLLLARDATSDGQRHAIQVRSWFEPSAAEARGDTGGMVCIEIFDDGRTITPVEMQDLFEPNFTQPAGGRGTGIDLNLCQEIVRQHQGQIHAASSPGAGTTFTVRIPALEQTEDQPAPGG